MSSVATTFTPASCKVCATSLRPSDTDGFCCSGCRALFTMLAESGLTDAYAEAKNSRPPGVALPTETSTAAFDSPELAAAHVEPLASGLASINLVLEGVHCSACLWLLEKLPRLQTGVVDARLDLARATLRVTYDPQAVRLSTIAATLGRLGYTPHPADNAPRKKIRAAEDRALLLRMAVAGASTGNVMLLAVALYAGESSGMDHQTTMFLRWASLVMALPTIVYSADVFFRGALSALRTRTPHIDLPLALSLAAGFVHGVFNTVRGAGPIYFDSVVALVFALLASRYLHQRKQREATDATDLVQALTPHAAHVVREGALVETPPSALVIGDRVEVRNGETVPADGTVIQGTTSLDRSLLTGESVPVPATVGDAVHAGTSNVGPAFQFTVSAAAHATRIAKLLQRAQDASTRRAPVLDLADRLSSFFVVVVIALAAVALVRAWPQGSDVALDRAIALLIVTCPCALGLATPLAMTCAMGRAATQRLFIKSSDALERLASARTIVFDKTGTLTTGKLSLARWSGPEWLRPLVGALERDSQHPFGRALASALPASELRATDSEETPGFGIVGRVSGHVLRVGTPPWLAEHASFSSHWHDVARALAEDGISPVAIACDGVVVGIAGLVDTIRDDARGAVRALERSGLAIHVLSGDNPRIVERVARELGITTWRGYVTPEQKLEAIRALDRDAPVIMVGDGVNDAGALAAARVGIAVQGGAETSLAVADIYVGRPGLDAIRELVVGARRTMGVIRTGFACGLFYNVLGVGLALGGWITPLMAAVIMPASSLSVVMLAYKRRTFDRS